jgi:hypothetical protein
MEVQVAFGRSGPVGERQVDVFEAVEPARPTLCGPGFIEILDRSVLRLQPGDEALPVRLRIGHEPVSDLVVVADGDDRGMVRIPFRDGVGEESRFTDVVRIADVVHVSLGGRYTRAAFADDVHARVCAMQPDRGRGARNVDDDPDSVACILSMILSNHSKVNLPCEGSKESQDRSPMRTTLNPARFMTAMSRRFARASGRPADSRRPQRAVHGLARRVRGTVLGGRSRTPGHQNDEALHEKASVT